MEYYAGEALDLASERRYRVYEPPRLDAGFYPEWPSEILGNFVEVAEEAEEGSSYCNLSPRSV